MIELNIDLKTRPQKRTEFLQTLDQLLSDLRREEGNLQYEYQASDDNVTQIHLHGEWQTWENLENHLRGNFFAILMGAIRVLCEKPVIKIDDGSKNRELDIMDEKWKKGEKQ